MSKNSPTKCSLKIDSNDPDQEGEMSATIYVAGGKMRQDIKMENENEGESFEMYFIVDEDWIYSWSSAEKVPGMKMKVSAMENMGQADTSQGLSDWNKDYDFKCRPWLMADKSKFTLPVGVEFKDMTETMQQFQGMMQDIDMDEIEKSGEEARAKLCQMCEMLPAGEARDECRANAECE